MPTPEDGVATVTLVSSDSAAQEGSDQRRLFRLTLDILVPPSHVDRVMELVAEALCGAPSDHLDPCNIAWTAHVTAGSSLVSDDFTETDLCELRAELQAIPVHATGPSHVRRRHPDAADAGHPSHHQPRTLGGSRSADPAT